MNSLNCQSRGRMICSSFMTDCKTQHKDTDMASAMPQMTVFSSGRTVMAHVLRLGLFFLLFLIFVPCRGATDHEGWNHAQYKSYTAMSGKALLKKGDWFLLNKRQPDSALMCYTVVAERYKPNMSKEDILLCLEGFYGRWQTFFFGYGNPSMAMDDLSTASQIQAQTGEPSPKLDYFYGICYMNIGTNTGADVLYNKAMTYFRRSFDEAWKQKDYRTLHRAYDNLLTAAYLSDSIQTTARQTQILRGIKEPEMWRKTQSLLIYEGFQLEGKGDLKRARECFQKLIDNIPHDMENMRYLASFYLKRERVEMGLKQYDKAMCTLDTMLYITYRYDFPDIRQAALWALRACYEATGKDAEARMVHNHYLELKDTLSSDRFMAGFQELTFATERRKMQNDMDAVAYRSRLKGWLIGLACVLLALTLLFLIILKRSNRKLHERSEMLYRQLQDTLNHNEDWIERRAPMLSGTLADEDVDNDADSDADAAKEDSMSDVENDDAEKYSGSGLTDMAKDELAKRIRQIMLHSPAIYDPDYSLGQLAEEVGSNRKYVSQSINELFDCNFWTLVNRARIREAMRRLNDNVTYGHYSIEGIAESVGFRSRSSFTSWFKRFTGLSAAEYRRLGGKVGDEKNSTKGWLDWK